MTEIPRREDYVEEIKAMFNHICLLHDTELVRLIGFHEDALDYYYHVRYMRGNVPVYLRDRGTLETFASFVGACVSLKDIYPRYEHMDSVFALNGCPREDEFKLTFATYEENLAMYGKDTADWYRDCDHTVEDGEGEQGA